MKELVKLDDITVADLGAEYEVVSQAKTEKEIRFLGEKMDAVGRISLVIAYELGRRLVAVKRVLDHGQFLPWLAESIGVTPRSAQNYMRLYEHFKEAPAALLEETSLREAYVMAGVKKAIAPGGDDEETSPLQFAGKADDAAVKANMVALFKQPTMSGVTLKNHRVDNVGGRVYVYRKDIGMASPALDFFLPIPKGLPEQTWIDYQKGLAIATELYLEKLEQYEATGMVEPPEDKRVTSVMERVDGKPARRVGPGFDEEGAKAGSRSRRAS